MPDTNNILLQEERQEAKQYRRSLWLVEHREGLEKIGIGLLVVLDVCLLLFVAWSLLDSFLISAAPERTSLVDAVSLNQEELHAYTAARAAAPISISDARVFPSANGKYDFYAQLENGNADWWADVQYQFLFDGGETPVRDGFILPSSTKPIAELAFASASPVQNAQLQFVSVSWHRVDRHVISDYASWSQDRLRLEIKNPTLAVDTSIDPKGVTRTTFTVTNNTAFNYLNPTFYLLMKRGGTVAGVNRVVLQSLDAGETQDVVVNWFGSVGTGNQVEIVPDVNLFDSHLYKALQGAPSLDTRSLAP